MSNTIKVIAAMLDTKELTLYTENGSKVYIQQGDPQLQRIVDEVLPVVSAGGIAEVELNASNVYSDFEEKSNGVVRFFRIAKQKLKEILGNKTIQTFPRVGPEYSPEMIKQVQKLANAVSQIQENALASTDGQFSDIPDDPKMHGDSKADPDYDNGDTVVAIVDGDKIVPDAHKVTHQLARANSLGSPEGMTNFLRRCALTKREHSVEDLMQFMKRGDLQVADDGSIIIYKILNRHHSTKDMFVDCHTGKVPQRIGSYVCMDESLVDPNRRTECSNGLHVARRSYLHQFSGAVCVLAKVAPEDVIAVPTYDADKMRVCGYHILFLLDDADYRKVRKNERLDSPNSKRQLALAVSGDHVGKLEEVRITQQKGNGVVITPLVKGIEAKEEAKAKTLITEEHPMVEPINETLAPITEAVEPLNPEAITAINEKAIEAKQLSRKEQAAALYQLWADASFNPDAQALVDLITFKKAAKVSWEKLGIPASPSGNPLPPSTQGIQGKKVTGIVLDEIGSDPGIYDNGLENPQPQVKKGKKMPESVKKELSVKRKQKPKKAPSAMTAIPTALAVPNAQQTHAERIRSLLNAAPVLTTLNANSIMMIKQQAKKSWEKLGVNELEAARIKQTSSL